MVLSRIFEFLLSRKGLQTVHSDQLFVRCSTNVFHMYMQKSLREVELLLKLIELMKTFSSIFVAEKLCLVLFGQHVCSGKLQLCYVLWMSHQQYSLYKLWTRLVPRKSFRFLVMLSCVTVAFVLCSTLHRCCDALFS